uniref:Uncharacterized protein n=1 Tax=Mesocestoides corti TaxID=53468 RepID=A0A5K3EP39_MESCO
MIKHRYKSAPGGDDEAMSRIRHSSLEQTPPERLPRLGPLSTASNPASPHKLSESHDPTPYRPITLRRTPDDITTDLRTRHPSDQQKPLRPSSLPKYSVLDQHNTFTGAATDARRVWISNLRSVTSGVAVRNFNDDAEDEGGEGDEDEEGKPEKRRLHHLKEYRQRRRERRDSRNLFTPESENEPVSWCR